MPQADRHRTAGIAQLRDLGPKSAAMLASVGITTPAQLRARGAVAAYVAVKRKQTNASLNLLYALVAALENTDWKAVQRERKLELLLAVEEYEHAHPAGRATTGKPVDELSRLRNIGKAMRADFELLGIHTVKGLARCDADELYARIQKLTHSRHDPCVWDTYAAAIHQAKTGEALPWWEFTKVRKQRQALTLPSAIAPGIALPPAFIQSSPETRRGFKRKQFDANQIPLAVATKFHTYSADIRAKLLSIRQLILEVAAATAGVGELEETLKWGQISYVTSQTDSGSLIRLDQHGASTSEYALYFHCQTTLVDTFRELFGRQFRYEGNRCLVFEVRKPIPIKALRHCIELALTYHLGKKTAKSAARQHLRRIGA